MVLKRTKQEERIEDIKRLCSTATKAAVEAVFQDALQDRKALKRAAHEASILEDDAASSSTSLFLTASPSKRRHHRHPSSSYGLAESETTMLKSEEEREEKDAAAQPKKQHKEKKEEQEQQPRRRPAPPSCPEEAAFQRGLYQGLQIARKILIPRSLAQAETEHHRYLQEALLQQRRELYICYDNEVNACLIPMPCSHWGT